MANGHLSSHTHGGQSNGGANNKLPGAHRYGPRLDGTLICMALTYIQAFRFVLKQNIRGSMGLQG